MTLPRSAYRRLAERLIAARTAVVCGHVRPDGDAVGSVLGLTAMLRGCGVDAVPTLADEGTDAPGAYAFLPGSDGFVEAASTDPPELFVALDTPNRDRLGTATVLADSAREIVVVDHHPDNAEYGAVNAVDQEASAVGQMLWRLMPDLRELCDYQPSAEVATCLYTALLTDTGGFRYSNTTPDALRDAAAMVEAGADAAAISRAVYETRSPAAVALASRALSRLELVNGGRVALSWIAEEDFGETGARADETEHLIDMLRMLGGVEAIVFLVTRDGECRANLRAKGQADVGSVARRLGGGGHAAAAGLTYAGTREALLGELLPMLPGGSTP